MEGGKAIVEGNWARWFGFVFVPSAEFGDNPGCPGESVRRMRVSLTFGLALHSVIEDGDEPDLALRERKGCRLRIASITSLHELDDNSSGLGGHRHQLCEANGGCQFHVFHPQSLQLAPSAELPYTPT